MDLPWGDEKTVKFITNVGLLTSYGPHGQNVMACEWTHHISYSPGLIAVFLGIQKATVDNIRKTKEFGISLTSVEQSAFASVAGGSSGKNVNKIKVLEYLGFKFYKAKKIKPLMVKDAAMNAECKLFKEITFGDHIMFIGEVVEAQASDKEPLAYHQGKYWKMTTLLEKPSQEYRDNIKKLVEKYKK